MFFIELLGLGFDSVGLFFLFGLISIENLISIFTLGAPFVPPPDIINYTRNACICQALFSKFSIFFQKKITEAFLPRLVLFH